MMWFYGNPMEYQSYLAHNVNVAYVRLRDNDGVTCLYIPDSAVNRIQV